MLEGIALDQLRMLVTAAEAGSFSAAARQLGRTQSAVSEAIAQLEAQLGVRLFDRSKRYPRLTQEGEAMLHDARSALAAVDSMRSRARGLSTGVEIELAAAVDFFVPPNHLVATLSAFKKEFAQTPVRLFSEALGAVATPVLNGTATLGVLGSLPAAPTNVLQERVGEVAFVWVAAQGHSLARDERLTRAEVELHTQIVLSDRSEVSTGASYGVLSPKIWMVSDVHAKLALLLGGLGWGGMPLHLVEDHLQGGRLVELRIERWTPERLMLPLTAIYRADDPPGPAARWFVERLKQCFVR